MLRSLQDNEVETMAYKRDYRTGNMDSTGICSLQDNEVDTMAYTRGYRTGNMDSTGICSLQDNETGAVTFTGVKKKKCFIGEIRNGFEEVVDLARQINLEVDSDDVQKLLDSHIGSCQWMSS
ncbi:hypothetical protein TNCV_2289881 [Trichonephila clavipes]|uniref:Uncharacterized protein n=1 Tax=Trichonephila clavipes TaxID=2585209 RepID=A0A8X6RJF4_TRICX|nr:hypothetical protein TNCV_2289881 [Trichonephila clavipes]